MPSYKKGERRGVRYIRTVDGIFRDADGEEYEAFVGRIVGLSREKGTFTKGAAQGTPVDSLNIHMDVTEENGEVVRYIISTTFCSGYPGRENPGVFARMLLFRLGYRDNHLRRDEDLDIGAYGSENSHATNASLRRPSVTKALPGHTVPPDKKEDAGWILRQMEKAYVLALEIFGAPPAEAPTQHDDDGFMPNEDPFAPSAPLNQDPPPAKKDDDLPF